MWTEGRELSRIINDLRNDIYKDIFDNADTNSHSYTTCLVTLHILFMKLEHIIMGFVMAGLVLFVVGVFYLTATGRIPL